VGKLVARDLFHRYSVDLALRAAEASEDAERVLLYERGEIACLDEPGDLGKAAAMLVIVFVLVRMGVFMAGFFLMFVGLFMLLVVVRVVVVADGAIGMHMGVGVLVAVVMRRVFVFVLLVRVGGALVDAEANPLNLLPLLPLEVHVKVADLDFGKLPLES
jgi:hypothetical protein